MFSVLKQQKNLCKLGKTNIQNMWQEVTSYLPCRILSKEMSKAVSSRKNENTVYKRILATSARSGLVGNDLAVKKKTVNSVGDGVGG
jgi:hypothetical protein